MAEANASRNNAGPVGVRLSPGEMRADRLPDELGFDLPELQECTIPANNPSLTRSAEAVGRGIGAAVAGVRNLPEQLRSRIHMVGGRGDIRSSLAEIKNSAAQNVAEWRDSAENRLAELEESAQTYAYQAADRANRRLGDLGRQIQRRVAFLRQRTRRELADFRQLQSEKPLQVIGAFAAAGFAAGVALRIWRSNRA
jgi:ElaB/YqjD/DUF883 family membrane-anchored ribosome-binding protein